MPLNRRGWLGASIKHHQCGPAPAISSRATRAFAHIIDAHNIHPRGGACTIHSRGIGRPDPDHSPIARAGYGERQHAAAAGATLDGIGDETRNPLRACRGGGSSPSRT